MKIAALLLEEVFDDVDSGSQELNPLHDMGALLEAEIIRVSYEATTRTAAIIFDLRNAFQLDDGNTGVLIAHGVVEFSWEGTTHTERRSAWTVMRSLASVRADKFSFEVLMSPDARLCITADSATFLVGEVSNIECIPDYSDDDVTVEALLPRWASEFSPVRITNSRTLQLPTNL